VANNGREAVEILLNGPQPPPFDVVLMDLQMPEMDGYQATARLRSDARINTLPIIAMTAHATIEERQRCLAAGMVDHISKPIDPESLFETVGRFYKPLPANPHVVAARNPANQPQKSENKAPPGLPTIVGLDTRDGLTRVAGNTKLYSKLLRQFAEQQGPAIGQIETALAQGDGPLAERLAHTLKGVAGNIGAKAVQASAGALEKAVRDHAANAQVEAALRSVASDLDPLVAQLRTSLLPEAPIPAVQGQASARTMDRAQTCAVGEQLAMLLSEFDPGAADFIETNQGVLAPLFPGPSWTAFANLIQAYSFGDAQAQLEQALKNLPAP